MAVACRVCKTRRRGERQRPVRGPRAPWARAATSGLSWRRTPGRRATTRNRGLGRGHPEFGLVTILATLSPLYFLLFCFYAAIQGTVQRAEEGATKTQSAVQFPVALPPSAIAGSRASAAAPAPGGGGLSSADWSAWRGRASGDHEGKCARGPAGAPWRRHSPRPSPPPPVPAGAGGADPVRSPGSPRARHAAAATCFRVSREEQPGLRGLRSDLPIGDGVLSAFERGLCLSEARPGRGDPGRSE